MANLPMQLNMKLIPGTPLYVNNPDAVVRLINDVKKNLDPSVVTSIVYSPTHPGMHFGSEINTVQLGMITGSQQPKRIFVSVYKDPTDFKIVMLKGNLTADWDRFLKEVRGKLDIPPTASSLQMSLADNNITVTGAAELESGDKIICRYY